MKRILNIIITLLVSLSFINTVNAASSTISVSSSSNQVIVGKDVTVYVTISSSSPLGSWEYTLNYDNSVFKLQSSDVALHYASYANNSNTKTVQYRYVFRALKSGSSKFYIDSSMVVGWDEKIMTVSDGSKTIKTLTYSEYQASLSSNNNLNNLTVEGYEITPEFNKDVLEYSVKVNEDETKVKINAQVADKTATVSGAGEVEVTPGSNTFDIVVIAQNGSEKTYKLTVEVIDKNPINVEVDGKKYTVVKLANNLIKPESYVEKTLIIDEIEIPGFYSEVTEFNLVGLKDEAGTVSLFIYNAGEYEPYNEINIGGLNIYPKSMVETIKEYQKTKVNIQNIDVEALTLNEDSRFRIIYGLNVETKEEGLYLYDIKDQSLIKYNDEYIKILEEKNEMLTYSTLAFVVSTILALFGIIGLSKKKKRKNNKLAENKNEIKKETKKDDVNEIVEVKKENSNKKKKGK